MYRVQFVTFCQKMFTQCHSTWEKIVSKRLMHTFVATCFFVSILVLFDFLFSLLFLGCFFFLIYLASISLPHWKFYQFISLNVSKRTLFVGSTFVKIFLNFFFQYWWSNNLALAKHAAELNPWPGSSYFYMHYCEVVNGNLSLQYNTMMAV